MKRKIIICLFVLFCVYLITGCGKTSESNGKNNETKINGNSVVIYFSATGTTKTIAEKISRISNSDIIEIITNEEYKPEDLNYNSDCRANREQNDNKSNQRLRI